MTPKLLTLYHTGFQAIPVPDVHYGRKNADFGPGFYTSPDLEFSRRWARHRKGSTTWLNTYTLDLEGLWVAALSRDAPWLDVLFANRSGDGDPLGDRDVVLGPIANDTLYDLLGVTTSGLLPRETAMEVLLLGPEYRQVVVKSEKAAARLTFRGAEVLDQEEVARYRAAVRAEEQDYQRRVGELLAADPD